MQPPEGDPFYLEGEFRAVDPPARRGPPVGYAPGARGGDGGGVGVNPGLVPARRSGGWRVGGTGRKEPLGGGAREGGGFDAPPPPGGRQEIQGRLGRGRH